MEQKKKPLKCILPPINGITIDGKKSKDLDDGIALRDLGNGNYILDVCIAHVVDFVPFGSRRYNRAYDRVTTLYHAAGNEPMLPRSLSEDQASLLEKKRRKAILFRIPINATTLEIGELSIKEVIFTSKRKMSYEEVEGIIRGETECDPQIKTMLQKLDKLAQKLLQQRRRSGALAIYDINKGWRTNEEGQLIKVSEKDMHRAEVIVQELMILTNHLAAQYLKERNIPFVVRNHTARVTEFDMNGILQQYEYFLHAPADKTEQALSDLQVMCNMQMNKATYAVTSVGHIGLALPIYAHFTSPIRRLADLLNQYILVSLLRNQRKNPLPHDELVPITVYLNERLLTLRSTVSKSYNDKWKAHVNNLVEKESPITEMTDHEFTTVLKRALLDVDFLQLVKEQIYERVIKIGLSQKSMMHVVFAGVIHDDILKIKGGLLEYLSANPHIAKSVIEIAISKQRLSDYKSSSRMQGENPPLFTTSATCIFTTQEYTASVMTTQKKAGEHIACVHLIAKIMGMEIPVIQQKVPVKKIDTDATLPEVEDDNFTGALHIYCQKLSIPLPTYGYTSTSGFFTCNVEIIKDQSTLSQKGVGQNKKSAKNAASANLYRELKNAVLV